MKCVRESLNKYVKYEFFILFLDFNLERILPTTSYYMVLNSNNTGFLKVLHVYNCNICVFVDSSIYIIAFIVQ